ncbi:hypothetical protein J5N97_015441 [Dioscorea zingiberensis]|uniref:Agenet domain-containing protein n=1 Tax=Dioscorea zingiberensis TaxID=325984 RepID=A0A9D5HL60_9LILI|nr:hypothetical protein J5N97_015441 [Dioscorea zingiberensis]
MMRPPGEPFRTGDKVEVSIDKEGFRGSWYEARVARFMPNLALYTIDYETIVVDTQDCRPLRETVPASNVRPRPPYLGAAWGERYAIHQLVDAYHNEGWWTGAVSEVRGEQYSVFFPSTGETIAFRPSEVRAHLDWVNDRWVVPDPKRMTKTEFREGRLVEVSSDEEGFCGAWFTATIIQLIGKKKFLVEYKDLKTDDETEFLKERVDSLHIRPTPPAIPVPEKFNLLEEIDAFHNDGWWEGVISKVLGGSKYIVYFRHFNEELEFGHEDLRLHYDWIDGRWLRRTSQALLGW